jgi:hypothetical protein
MDELEKQEILNTYRWIKVPKYVDDENLPWCERYNKLQEHHIKETTFLIEQIRAMVSGEV